MPDALQDGSQPATAPRAPRIVAVLGALLTLGTLADAIGLDSTVGLVLYTEQKLLVFLGIALVLAFLYYPARATNRSRGVPWFDWTAAAAAMAACGFAAFDYERIFDQMQLKPIDAVIASILIIALSMEALRRSAGMMLFGFLLVFLAYALFGHFLPGPFEAREVALDRLALYLALDSSSVLGMPLIVTATMVIAFIFFGKLLSELGGATFLTEISTAMMGRYRGGPAKIAIVSSALFGSISGSAIANVVSTGVVTIPMMKKAGYRPKDAGAIEAVASTGGQLMPPVMGAVAFLMAEFLQIGYAEVALAALMPALLYYWALFVQVDLLAGRSGFQPVDPSEIPRGGHVLRAGWLYFVPFAVIIVCLFNLNLRPDLSALWAAASVLPIGIWSAMTAGGCRCGGSPRRCRTPASKSCKLS